MTSCRKVRTESGAKQTYALLAPVIPRDLTADGVV